MAERSTVGRKVYTLEESLKEFDMPCWLEQLDMSLETVRWNKETPAEHLNFQKSVDKNLLKLSLDHHPDRATNQDGSSQEIANAQNRQVALNATRTVLRALTKAFLDNIDIHYRYEFFAKMDVTALINEKEMDRQITNVLCKISFLSEVKRVSIVGQIRKFLQESRKSLSGFQKDDRDEFERRRDNALRHLHECVEGYEALVAECDLVVRECRSESDGGAKMSAIQKISDQSRRELKILQELETIAKGCLGGTFQIYSVFVPRNKYDHFLVSPFVFYVNVMSMCTLVAHRKSRSWKKRLSSNNTNIQLCFEEKPELFFNAYHLSFYFNNKELNGRQVEIILQKKNLSTTNDNIVQEFKDVVKKIEDFLAEEFVFETYKEGKSNREQFNEKLSKLNESMAEYRAVEKELQEKLKLCKKETYEVRKEYMEFAEKIQETEEQCRENLLKCKMTSDNFA